MAVDEVFANSGITRTDMVHYIPRAICAVAFVVALIALLALGGNALTKVCRHGGDYAQGTVNGLWQTAKWTGITGGVALGTSLAIDILHGVAHGARNHNVHEGTSKMKEEMAKTLKTLMWGVAFPVCLGIAALDIRSHHDW